ncbi:MAG: hypothetical protein FJ087_13305 [Deltaproteobacteria bacterium]|nr:hypothetical protein [Deltaproteobacteria bacterium]
MADSAPKEDAAADAAYEFGLPPTGVPAFDLDGCWWYVQCIHDCAPGDAACRTACAAGLSDVVSGVAPGVAECVDQEGCWNADGTLDLICLYATCKDSYLDCYVETPEGSCRGNFICLAHCTWDEATEGREWVQCVDENCLLDDGPAGSEAAFNMMACVNHECPGCLFDDPPPGCGVCAVEARCGACKDETDLCFGHRGFRGCVWSYQCTARCASENQPDTCSFDCDSMTSIEADCAVRRLRACILEACKANPECGKDYWCPCAQAAMKGECKQFWDACLAVPDAQ